MTTEPIHLPTALASFDALWSPRIVTTVNNHDIRVAKVAGEHIWHTHDHTDEFFLVLDGELNIAVRDGADGAGRVVTLPKGSVFVVPRGTEHKPFSPDGASIMVINPTGTPSVGDRHDAIPDHIDVTTGHALTAS